MPLIVWIASAALALSLPVAWWALTGDRQLSKAVKGNLADQQITMREAVLERSAAERFIGPLASSVGQWLLRFTPVGWMRSQTKSLGKAGLLGRITPEQVLGAKILLPTITGVLLLSRAVGSGSARSYLLAISLTILMFFVPDLVIRVLADRRAEEITLVLPDVLDQLTISVEAGLGFESALARIASTDDHALAQEFGRMLQDIKLGTRRIDALDSLAQRSSVNDLRQVVLALRQAESLGVPLARTLRSLSLDMREKRRFRAEERANQLPIKMIFPLGLCILPALFIVILGPAVVTFMQRF